MSHVQAGISAILGLQYPIQHMNVRNDKWQNALCNMGWVSQIGPLIRWQNKSSRINATVRHTLVAHFLLFGELFFTQKRALLHTKLHLHRTPTFSGTALLVRSYWATSIMRHQHTGNCTCLGYMPNYVWTNSFRSKPHVKQLINTLNALGEPN